MTSLAARALIPSVARRLEVVDGARAELDRERDRAGLRELVAVEAQREAGVAARLEVAARLRRVEGAALEEDVGRFRDLGSFGQHLGEREVEVRVGVGELRRDRVRAEPRRDAARVADRAERRELGVLVEPVAGLRLERRRAGGAHPVAVTLDGGAQAVLAERARRADGGEDPAAGRVQLLVARAASAERELVHAVAAERRVRVAVDEARNRAHARARRPRRPRPRAAGRSRIRPTAVDRLAVAEDERVLEHVDLAERGAAQRRVAPGRRRELREVADEQLHRDHEGSRKPPASAASSASG